MIRSLALGLVLITGCKYGLAISNQGFCLQGAAVDVRIGLTYCSAGDVELEHSKEASSEQFMKAAEEVLPQMIDAAVKAALACAGISAVGGLVEACSASEAVKPVLEGVQSDAD